MGSTCGPSLYLATEGKKMAQATRMQKNQARKMYEEDGESVAAISRHIGFGPQSVANWAKKGGWVKYGTAPATPEPEPETETVAAPAEWTPPVEVPSNSEADLRARLAKMEAENRRLLDENKQLKPTVDIGDYVTDRVKWITDNSPEGEDYWLNRAEASFKKENMQRAKDGLPVFNIADHPELLDNLIAEIKTKEAINNAKEPNEPAYRRVKLLIMRNGMPTIEQIPMEAQVNNMAGSLADGIIRYTRKGFKLTDPFLCPRAGCFRPAQNDELGRWLYDGYCTDRHRTEVEGKDKSPTVGLQTKDTVLSGIG